MQKDATTQIAEAVITIAVTLVISKVISIGMIKVIDHKMVKINK